MGYVFGDESTHLRTLIETLHRFRRTFPKDPPVEFDGLSVNLLLETAVDTLRNYEQQLVAVADGPSASPHEIR